MDKKILLSAKILILLITFISCKNKKDTTGWNYNESGFEEIVCIEQPTAPGMILVEGGNFTFKFDNQADQPKSLSAFYISAHEETNGQYLSYLNFLKKSFSNETYVAALPDTLVWMRENLPDSVKNFLANNYLRNKIFRNYPVVGVNRVQIEKYAKWKTDRLNEMILIREGLLQFNPNPKDSTDFFDTDAYLSVSYPSSNENPESSDTEYRKVKFEDGILYPQFRLPSEDEWTYAALAIGDKDHTYLITPDEEKKCSSDKTYNFDYLFPSKEENKTAIAFFQKTGISIKPVHLTQGNNYNILGLYENVSEMASSGSVIGGSWLSPAPVYKTVYDKNASENNWYTQTNPFKEMDPGKYKGSANTGFRLVMNRINSTGGKRRKAKGN
ncbi:MAG: hypothetical protein A2W91_04540 [Bacteroidetes bacterium GWF2_38_335]|nr:MAG: hypothetical protein A2W91_04540 [Bacteroidetes bacterium GWF2_38_335]HBS88224.1 hypothetical protein [Bacteroidales bacterium]